MSIRINIRLSSGEDYNEFVLPITADEVEERMRKGFRVSGGFLRPQPNSKIVVTSFQAGQTYWFVDFKEEQITTVGKLKEYLVIRWESRVMKMIPYDETKKFWHFTSSIQSAFEITRSIKLYKLSPHAPVDQRILISSKEQLESVLQEIDSAEDEENAQILFVFMPTLNNSSPNNSPGKQTLDEEEKSSESSSKLSEGKKKERERAKQSKFREDLLYRDGDKCRLCSQSPVEAAHIIDVEAKLKKDELRRYGLYDIYYVSNGVILCRLCHWNYDHFVIGINEDGFLVTKEKGEWRTSLSVSIFRTPEERGQHSSPLKEALRWKYGKFILKRDNKTVVEQISETFERLWTPKKDYKFAHEEKNQEEPLVAITLFGKSSVTTRQKSKK